ncbi:MAG: hypothetical protein RIE59_27175 [Imperialibacter sp.]
MADFGYGMVFFKNGSNLFTKSTLVFTVNYNLKPVDKDVSLRTYPFYSLNRVSAVLGLATTSIAEEGVRANLLGSNNLIVGVGYHPIHSVRVSYGALLFSEIGPNKILSNNQQLKATPYATVTLDLNLKDLLGGIVAALGIK